MENKPDKYELTISLNVLNHLGIKLYSNVPSVLSEAVANAWDADADEVKISITPDTITIQDNGHGMNVEDINRKYLNVGYDRRKHGFATTEKYKRPVMGRKGIGKLSLFSIANKIKIETIKDSEENSLLLESKKIEAHVKGAKRTEPYHPVEIKDPISFSGDGTKITITDIKRMTTAGTVDALKKRLARRFSVLGASHNFSVSINGDEIKVTDRDYYHKLQYIWFFGEESRLYTDYCDSVKLEHSERRGDIIEAGSSFFKVSGWIGTVSSSGDLKDGDDNLNKIIVMVRGKLAQEDIMEDFAEGGVYTKYIIGEVHADFLDEDNEEDIATTSRQEIIKDDPRYQALRAFVQAEIKFIQSQWTQLRNDEGVKRAVKNPAIKAWFSSLGADNKKKAEKLFGKINQLTIESEDQRSTLFKHAILAFETLKYKENLDALEYIDANNLEAFTKVFSEHNDIEATLYHQITDARVSVIRKLQEQVKDDALEKVVQKHLFENLWLLDPAWDRATETPLYEQSVSTAFADIEKKSSNDEKAGRFDIKYKNSAGKHIIIELKRPGRTVSTAELLNQVEKYRNKLMDILKEASVNEPVEVVCVVGEKLSDWIDDHKREESRLTLLPKNIRVVLYQELIDRAYKMYSEYLEKSKESGKVLDLIRSIKDSDNLQENE